MIKQRLDWYLTRLNYSRKITVNEKNFRAPCIKGITCRVNEQWMTQMLAVILPQRQGTFFDCGVNVGQTLLKVKAVDERRAYIGFEPNPVCVFYVAELIKANSLNNCTILPVGLFNKDGLATLSLHTQEATNSAASIMPNLRPKSPVHAKIHVPVLSVAALQDQLREHTAAVVKIDVEGAELEVLKELRAIINKDRPPILMEILPAYKEDSERKARQDQVEQILTELGYAFFKVIKNESDDFESITRLSTIGINDDWQDMDYLFLAEEQTDHWSKQLAQAHH